jgi:hypothetical protein
MTDDVMPLDAALRELDLNHLPTTTEEVERAFRVKAHAAHPDHGASRDAWDKLEQARKVVLAHCSDTGSALEIRALREVVLANQTVLNQVRRKDETAETKRAVIRRRTSAVTSAKRRAWAVTGVGAVSTAGYKLVRSVFYSDSYRSPPVFDRTTVLVTILLASMGVIGIALKLYADRLEQAVEDLTAELSDRDTFLLLMAEICAPESAALARGRWWTRTRLEEGVAQWMDGVPDLFRVGTPWSFLGVARPALASIARKVGAADTTRLMLAKGLEVGSLEQRSAASDVTEYAWGAVAAGPSPDGGPAGPGADPASTGDDPREPQWSTS